MSGNLCPYFLTFPLVLRVFNHQGPNSDIAMRIISKTQTSAVPNSHSSCSLWSLWRRQRDFRTSKNFICCRSSSAVGYSPIHQLVLIHDLKVFDWQGGFLRSGSTNHPVKSHLKCGFVDRLAGHNYDHLQYHPYDLHHHDGHHHHHACGDVRR